MSATGRPRLPYPGPEDHADAMEDAARSLAETLRTGPRSLDSRAVFLGMSRTAGSVHMAALYLRSQGWLPLDATEEPEMTQQWERALAALSEASRLFEEIANGWI